MVLIDPITCLAAALYFEARGEPRIEQLKVAEVIFNRVESDRYPNTICEVVKQQHQFTFYWDGQKEEIKNKKAWRISLNYASQSLYGEIDMPGFCHYAHRVINNHWTRTMKRHVEGAHAFYEGGC